MSAKMLLNGEIIWRYFLAQTLSKSLLIESSLTEFFCHGLRGHGLNHLSVYFSFLRYIQHMFFQMNFRASRVIVKISVKALLRRDIARVHHKNTFKRVQQMLQGVSKRDAIREGWRQCHRVQPHFRDCLRSKDQICARGVPRRRMHNYNRRSLQDKLRKDRYDFNSPLIYSMLRTLWWKSTTPHNVVQPTRRSVPW